MRSRHQSCDIQQLDGTRPSTVDARAVVGFAAIGDIEAGAGARDLEEPDCTLRVDGGEAVSKANAQDVNSLMSRSRGVGGKYGKLPTLAVASVRLLRVVDLPLLGLPTRAISGSRGI